MKYNTMGKEPHPTARNSAMHPDKSVSEDEAIAHENQSSMSPTAKENTSLEDLKQSMPKFLEKKLKREYGENSKIPYAVMNKIGAMHGNKITAKGKAMEAKHNKKSHEKK